MLLENSSYQVRHRMIAKVARKITQPHSIVLIYVLTLDRCWDSWIFVVNINLGAGKLMLRGIGKAQKQEWRNDLFSGLDPRDQRRSKRIQTVKLVTVQLRAHHAAEQLIQLRGYSHSIAKICVGKIVTA